MFLSTTLAIQEGRAALQKVQISGSFAFATVFCSLNLVLILN